MKVLVTGGAGLVGSHAAEFYAKGGHEVTILDNLIRSKLFSQDKESVEYNWNYLAQYPNLRRVKGDIRNDKDVREALGGGADLVIHAAAQPGVPRSVRDPKEDFDINAFGTLNVLEGLRKTSPKATFVYCSTNKVYGENVDQIPIHEDTTRYLYDGVTGVSESMSIDLTGHTPYGVSKATGDLYVQEYAAIYGMKTGVFRCSCIYGTRQFGFEDQGWVAWFAIASLLGKPITIYGNGKQVRDLLYVEDLVAAFDAFHRSRLPKGVFNTGGGPGQTLSLLELLKLLAKLTGKSAAVTFSDWRPSDQKVYISDVGRITMMLGWKPRVGVEEGIGRLVRWVEENRNLF